MKSHVSYTPLTAEILFQEAPEKCLVVDKYVASAGLLVPKKGRHGSHGDEAQDRGGHTAGREDVKRGTHVTI